MCSPARGSGQCSNAPVRRHVNHCRCSGGNLLPLSWPNSFCFSGRCCYFYSNLSAGPPPKDEGRALFAYGLAASALSAFSFIFSRLIARALARNFLAAAAAAQRRAGSTFVSGVCRCVCVCVSQVRPWPLALTHRAATCCCCRCAATREVNERAYGALRNIIPSSTSSAAS